MSETPLRPDAPLMDAVRAIEGSHRRIAVVVNADGVVVGTLTDGDVRRCLLSGGTLQTPVDRAMNDQPIVAEDGASDAQLISLMRRGHVLALPLVDAQRRFRRLLHLSDLKAGARAGTEKTGFEFAVIMAGGEGLRLRPVTQTLPKAMVDIAGVPLLER